MNEKLLKPYNPAETEERIYKTWEDSGYFNPDNLPERHKEPFSIVLPPPNATDKLHVGSAMMLAIEDIMVRYARMRGKKTLWLPGTDHAAIATHSKVEKILQKEEGKSRYDLGREAFEKKVNDFVEINRGYMKKQMPAMGASLDWSREAYTLDEPRRKAVFEAFKRMYDAGLIYRGHRVINWDPKGQTTVSDDEVVHEETKGTLYTFKYSKDFPISIATTRPETKVGDTAVAVHPEDKRYKDFIGKNFDVDFAGVKLNIKIIADENIDPKYGTGALGVTPAHSQADYEMGIKNNLPIKIVINEYAKMTDEAGELVAGLKTKEAREKIIEWLKENDLLEKEEEINQNISKAERTGGVIEPLPKLQWFVDVNKKIESRDNKSLKELMQESVSGGEIKILPERFEKTYFSWINNLRDWCISRQIWYGHRIPVKYDATHPENKLGYVVLKKPIFQINSKISDEIIRLIENNRLTGQFSSGTQPYMPFQTISFDIANYLINNKFDLGSTLLSWEWIKDNAVEVNTNGCKYPEISEKLSISDFQDPDTLDTWFSSGLWTFATMGWPEETSDLKTYHPTDVIESGYDILFFWMARMILMSQFHLGQVPFKTIYLHGLVRDEKGRKISKSLGNNVDPVDLIDKFGADALRMALIIGVSPGSDSNLGENKIKGYKNFANKLWNISRFVLENTEDLDFKTKPELSKSDQKRIDQLNSLIEEITPEMENYRYYLVSEKLYHYVWDTLASEIIEESKPILNGDDKDARKSAQWTLCHLLSTSLKLLHPFMPFITEELWSMMPHKGEKLLIIEEWPVI